MKDIPSELFDDEQVFPGVLLAILTEPLNEFFSKSSKLEIVSVKYKPGNPGPSEGFKIFWVLQYEVKTSEGNIVNFSIDLCRIFNKVQNEWRFSIHDTKTNKIAYSTFPKEHPAFGNLKARMANVVYFLLSFILS